PRLEMDGGTGKLAHPALATRDARNHARRGPGGSRGGVLTRRWAHPGWIRSKRFGSSETARRSATGRSPEPLSRLSVGEMTKAIGWSAIAGEAARRFGVRRFRPGQRDLIDAALAGRDALGILPTGGG